MTIQASRVQRGSYLIKGGAVITADPAIGTLPKADILVRDGIIVSVEPMLSANDVEVIDAVTNAKGDADEAANDCAGNAEQNRQQDTAWVVTRHQSFGDSATYKSNNDPGNYVHDFPPPASSPS